MTSRCACWPGKILQGQQFFARLSVDCGVSANCIFAAQRSKLRGAEQKLGEELTCDAAHLQRRTAHQQRSTAAAGPSKGTKKCLAIHPSAGLAATSRQWGRNWLLSSHSMATPTSSPDTLQAGSSIAGAFHFDKPHSSQKIHSRKRIAATGMLTCSAKFKGQ